MTYNHFPVFCTKRLMLLSLLLMGLGINLSNAQEVIFYTPRTVHIVKAKGDQPKQSSLVVTAHPEKVKVRKSTTDGITIYSTSALTVKVEGGKVAFYDPNGNLLTAEGESRFTPITEG